MSKNKSSFGTWLFWIAVITIVVELCVANYLLANKNTSDDKSTAVAENNISKQRYTKEQFVCSFQFKSLALENDTLL